jgi:ADP-heptose:LPS heptosyltransferase
MTAPARPLADPEVRRVVLVRLRTGLGDLLASGPALRSIRAARPDLHVTLVSYREVADVVARQAGWVDEFLPFPGHPDIPERPAPPPDVWTAFVADMHARRFDLAVQMYGALPAANAVTAQFGARLVGGFLTPGGATGSLATHLPYPFRAHEIDRHLRLVEFLGAPAGARELEFPLTPADHEEAARAVADAGAPGLLDRPFVIVHPGATADSRRWPIDRFAEVVRGVAARGVTVAVTGVPSERALVDALLERVDVPVVDLVGRTKLGGAAALVDRARVVISNDTGIVQVAVARRTPTVTVYLAGDARRWHGADPGRHRVLAIDVGCNPCGLLECPIDFRCATWLSPATVLAEVDHVL